MVRTNRIIDLLGRPTHVVDGDLSYFLRVSGTVGPYDPSVRRPAPDGVSMRWLRKHEVALGRFRELRRWACGFLCWRGRECALVQSAGKDDDEKALYVFDVGGYVEAVRTATGRAVVRHPAPVRREWHLADAGIQYGMCVDCRWEGVWVDRMVYDPCSACLPETALWCARSGAREAGDVGECLRRCVSPRGKILRRAA